MYTVHFFQPSNIPKSEYSQGFSTDGDDGMPGVGWLVGLKLASNGWSLSLRNVLLLLLLLLLLEVLTYRKWGGICVYPFWGSKYLSKSG